MAVTINASTSAGLVTSADTSGNLNLQSNGSTKLAITSAGAAVTGTLSATSFSGNGSALTGLSSPNFTNNFVRLSGGVKQTINQNTTVKFIQDTEQEDANGWWDATNHKFLPNKAGWYQVSSSWTGERVNTGECIFNCYIYKNGTKVNYLQCRVNHASLSTNNGPYFDGKLFVYLNGTTDYLENYINAYDYGGSSTQHFTLDHMFINWMGA